MKKILLKKNGELKGSIKSKLDEIMIQTDTQITCVSAETPKGNTSPRASEAENLDIEILGTWYAAEQARLHCLVLLDYLVKYYYKN
jgi:hypothetical protein